VPPALIRVVYEDMIRGSRWWAIGSAVALAAIAAAAWVALGSSEGRPAATPPSASSKVFLGGRIELDPALRDQVPPGAALFVYAYAVDGPRIPLALRRYPASALPLEFSLDDTAAVNSAFRLSMAPQVLVGARLGLQGPPESAAPGDLVGGSPPVALDAREMRIVIDKRVPPGNS
jgi:cytochrome c-type biogenesis protein CcmH